MTKDKRTNNDLQNIHNFNGRAKPKKKKTMINYYVYLHVSISAPAIFPVGPK
jgi:hypothetical protein